MVKQRLLISIIVFLSINACTQSFGPGNELDLFRDTPNWELAKAVDKEDTSKIRKLVVDKGLDLNFQENKFGRTILHLAIARDKATSVGALLALGADVKLRDYENNLPIHEASESVNNRRNSLKILDLLIKYNADVNSMKLEKGDRDTTYFYVPLMGASKDLECGKLLLVHGANPYVEVNGSYPVWHFTYTDTADQQIYFARYLIIEKRLPIPDPVMYSKSEMKPIHITDYLNKMNFNGNVNKEKIRKEILEYLTRTGFPKSNVYLRPSS